MENEIVKSLDVGENNTKIDIQKFGMQFLAVVDKLVSIEGGRLGEISKDEIEYQLEKAGSYQANFVAALSHLKKKLNEQELEYKIWYANKSADAKEKYMADLIQKVEDGEITKGNVKVPSKNDIDDYIIIHDEEEYRLRNTELNELQVDSTTVYDYLITLRQRGNDLRALLKQERDTENNSSTVIKQTNLEN